MLEVKKIFSLSLLLICFTHSSSQAQTQIDSLGKKYLKFDFPGLYIGIAENDSGPTGTTVFYFPEGVKAAADIRGGDPGTLNTSILKNNYDNRRIQAISFSGGSAYGLSAATGVGNQIKEIRTKEGNGAIAEVLGAIIYDLGSRRFSSITPDDALGRMALKNARNNYFPLGAQGAGRFAMQGLLFSVDWESSSADKYANWAHSGQGAAFRQIGETKVAVFTVVNAIGSIIDREGKIVRCGRNTSPEDCPSMQQVMQSFPLFKEGNNQQGATENTTISLIVTNQKLPLSALQRLAAQVHSSMARAIHPFATELDGDVLFAVTTDEVEGELTHFDLNLLASELAWDAILNSTPVLPEPPETSKNSSDTEFRSACRGTYSFEGEGKLEISNQEDALVLNYAGKHNIYFDSERSYQLRFLSGTNYRIEAPGHDIIRFNFNEKQEVISLSLNPGPWQIDARKEP